MALQLTRSADYMIRSVLHLAKQPPEAFVTRREIVQATGVPDQLFRKLAQSLHHAGIIEITQGARGGYRLAVPASSLTVLQVVEAAVGVVSLNECLNQPASCDRSPTCPVHEALGNACQRLRADLAAVTFAGLAERDRELTEHPAGA
jgi:Rrf2 family protein